MLDQNPTRKADWSEVSGAALPALRLLEKQYPGGFLVKMGKDFAWAFEDQGKIIFGAVDAAGTLQLHALKPGQVPGV